MITVGTSRLAGSRITTVAPGCAAVLPPDVAVLLSDATGVPSSDGVAELSPGPAVLVSDPATEPSLAVAGEASWSAGSRNHMR